MEKLKYFVLGTEKSNLLIEYFDKYYKKLLKDLLKIKNTGILNKEINLLFNNNLHRDFILNPDISSMINLIIIKKDSLIISKLKNEINIFLSEGLFSDNLVLNKGSKIYGTNIKLSIEDSNPYNIFDAHPEHIGTGGVLGYGIKTEKEWLCIYEKTFSLLKKVDIGIYSELNQIIKKIVPLGTSKGVHNSASYKECVGHLYMGYTIDSEYPEINNLEAIIHESSHNKLNLLMQLDSIVLNDNIFKYYSAIRPDARNIKGVFLGYHAFAPTMYIIMKAYKNGFLGEDKHWLEKITLYYMKTKFLQKVIKKYAILTDLGKEISEEIDYVIIKMDKIFKEIKPSKDIILKAKRNQIEHFKDVNKNYPELEY